MFGCSQIRQLELPTLFPGAPVDPRLLPALFVSRELLILPSF
jgi:hypothetical protein